MDIYYIYMVLFTSGALVGFLSGLLGIGGGIVMFPLLFYIPTAVGIDSIPVKDITGLTMIQGFFASLSAMFFHHEHRFVHKRLVFTFGLPLFVSSFIGAAISRRIPDDILLITFGILAMTAAAMMILPRGYHKDNDTVSSVDFNPYLTLSIGLPLGFFLGMVGQGGAFIIIPILLYLIKIPLRVALGSTLAIGLFCSSAGLVGKITAGQVPLLMSIAMLSGAVPFARIGGYISVRTNTRILKWILAVLIIITAIKIMWGQVLNPG